MADKTRKLWLDWQRGLAVLYMVEWHTYDSWRADAVAHRAACTRSLAIVGGFAAPSFLYMAGHVAAPRRRRPRAQGRPGRRAAAARAVRRALWLLGVAYLFRARRVRARRRVARAGRLAGDPQGRRPERHRGLAPRLGAPHGRPPAAGAGGRSPSAATAAVALLAPVVAGWQHPASRLLDYLYSRVAARPLLPLPVGGLPASPGSALARLALQGAEPVPLDRHRRRALRRPAGPATSAARPSTRTRTSGASRRPGSPCASAAWSRRAARCSSSPPRPTAGSPGCAPWGATRLLGYFVSIELPYGVLSSALHKRLGTWDRRSSASWR